MPKCFYISFSLALDFDTPPHPKLKIVADIIIDRNLFKCTDQYVKTNLITNYTNSIRN